MSRNRLKRLLAHVDVIIVSVIVNVVGLVLIASLSWVKGKSDWTQLFLVSYMTLVSLSGPMPWFLRLMGNLMIIAALVPLLR